jgi:hypothetical protein
VLAAPCGWRGGSLARGRPRPRAAKKVLKPYPCVSGGRAPLRLRAGTPALQTQCPVAFKNRSSRSPLIRRASGGRAPLRLRAGTPALQTQCPAAFKNRSSRPPLIRRRHDTKP